MLTRSQTSTQASSQTPSTYITRARKRLQQQDNMTSGYNTRSRSKANITLDVDIDFDDASREWNRNKRRVGQMYQYVCGQTCRSGNPCKKLPVNGELHLSLIHISEPTRPY